MVVSLVPQPAGTPAVAAESGAPVAPGAAGFDVALLLAALLARAPTEERRQIGSVAPAAPPDDPPEADPADTQPAADTQAAAGAALLAGSALLVAAVAPTPTPAAGQEATPALVEASAGAAAETAPPADGAAPVPEAAAAIAADAGNGGPPTAPAPGNEGPERAAVSPTPTPAAPASVPVPAAPGVSHAAPPPDSPSPTAAPAGLASDAEPLALATQVADQQVANQVADQAGAHPAPAKSRATPGDPAAEPALPHPRREAQHAASRPVDATADAPPVTAPDAIVHDSTSDSRDAVPRSSAETSPRAGATADAPGPSALSAAPAREVPRASHAHDAGAPESPAARTPDAVHQVERLVRLDELRPRPVHDGGDMRLELSPEGLGRIEVRVSVRDDGVQANLLAQQQHAREALELHRPALEAALGRSSLRLEGFTVGLGEHRQGEPGGAPAERRAPAADLRAGEPAAAPVGGISRSGRLSLHA